MEGKTMEPKEFTRFLLKSAVCVMGSDGEIHDNEIDEIRKFSQNTSYFKAIDFESELQSFNQDFLDNGKDVIWDYYTELNEKRELILFEVLIKIIYADNRVDENELTFLNMVRTRLKLTDDKIRERFGDLDILLSKDIPDIATKAAENIDLNLSDETIQVDPGDDIY